MKNDQRIAITRRMLKEGLLGLLKTKELNKVSVTELCHESGINRATFYRHYEQPRDILNDIRRDMFKDIRELMENLDAEEAIVDRLETVCAYFYDNRELLNVLFACRTDDEFVQLINETYKDSFSFQEFRNKESLIETDDDAIRLWAYYFSGGIYYLLRQWLREPIDKTPREMAELIHSFLCVR